MSEFYKLLFQPFQRLWIEQKKRTSMATLLNDFAMKHFESIFGQLNGENQREFVRVIMAVVHSHRHNKDDVAQNDKENSNTQQSDNQDSIDFTLVRDSMYKYSKQAQRRFFENPALAFLFAWFSHSPEGHDFIRNKYQEKGEEYLERINQEMGELRAEALLSLAEQARACQMAKMSSSMTPMLNRYIEVSVGSRC
ncbi:hypothetical protein FGO68_gene2458 [Halteria grandinella]|uniref:Uncharacterized protein n=1 Tax=Halteria grandinella TaxID=5974 RepID=A0A8J8SV32_HALGN|nr:hypothetical protein FGO68_gene2458 [Halteria grandinella]